MAKPEWMPENPWDKKVKSECSLSDYDRYVNSAEDWSEGSIATANAILDYLIAEYGMLDLGRIEKAGTLFKQMKSQLEKER